MKTTDVPTVDLTGRVFGKWTVLQFIGKRRVSHNGNPCAARDEWLCQCSCGREFPISKYNLTNQRSTQCQQCAYEEMRDANIHHAKYSTWRKHVRGDCCAAWSDFTTFADWAATAPNSNRRFICKHDQGLPHSPDNSYWSIKSGRMIERLKSQKATVLAYLLSRGVTQDEAERRVSNYSRQRFFQVLNNANGLCAHCQDPAVRHGACEKHGYQRKTPVRQNGKFGKLLAIDGIQKTFREWAQVANVPVSVIKGRLRTGWSADAAVYVPIDHQEVLKLVKENQRLQHELEQVKRELSVAFC